METERAETLALQVFDWILGSGDLADVFLGSSGAALEDLRENAAQPEFLAAVLDFVLMDDSWVLAAAEHLAIPPERLHNARAALPGGFLPNWT
ncbi:MAG: DUF3572 domain-containing protein [Mangrovicoccus sp.]|nr:DUF3572 domain-containing protein [Mangrovicoccus sp.]